MANTADLRVFQERLHTHFSALRAERDRVQPGAPVFALEHNLTPGELSILRTSVVDAVVVAESVDSVNEPNWLPFIVHTTEVGYEYKGDEYWPTLEERTPKWEANIGREFVRTSFQKFQVLYGGAIPQGTWAEHFRIIAWPITHAILPFELQEELAKLLYRSRASFNAENLTDVVALGSEIRSRSSNSHKRFQQFAKNTKLLGTVASALLKSPASSGLILPATLNRVISDLSKVEAAHEWLTEARRHANEVSVTGGRYGKRSSRTSGRGEPYDSDVMTRPPMLSARRLDAGWTVEFVVPDFKPLFAKFPDLGEELSNIRCQTAGSENRMRSRGWLRYPGSIAQIDQWPGSDVPLFRLENASDQANEQISNSARTPEDRLWVFHIGESGTGRLIRSRLLAPGQKYLVVGASGTIPPTLVADHDSSSITGADAITIELPDEIDGATSDDLKTLGLTALTTIRLTPIGSIPSEWDNSGYGEWVTGDRPLIQINTTVPVSQCTTVLDSAKLESIDWPKNQPKTVVLSLPGLAAGIHEVEFSFIGEDGSTKLAVVYLDLVIRDPDSSRDAGSFREPVEIQISPQDASLEEIWDGISLISIRGPENRAFSMRTQLLDSSGTILSSHKSKIQLPLRGDSWREFWSKQIRRTKQLTDVVEDADRLEIEVSDQELGRFFTRIDREIRPVRWRFRRKQNQIHLHLDNSGDLEHELRISHYTFEKPSERIEIQSAEFGDQSTDKKGGLYVANVGTEQSAAILPRTISNLQDLGLHIYIPNLDHSVDAMIGSLRIAKIWAEARTSGNFLESFRFDILDEFANRIASTIAGSKWAKLETTPGIPRQQKLERLGDLIDPSGQWQVFVQKTRELASGSHQEPPIREFAALLGPSKKVEPPSRVIRSQGASQYAGVKRPGAQLSVGEVDGATMLLLFASAPWALAERSNEDLISQIGPILESPVAFRAARLIFVSAQIADMRWTWN